MQVGPHLIFTTHGYDQHQFEYNGEYFYLPDADKVARGVVYFDVYKKTLVTSDGNKWNPIHIKEDDHFISLQHQSDNALDWAIDRMETEKLLKSAEKYPLVASLLEQLETALKLCKDLDNGPPKQKQK